MGITQSSSHCKICLEKRNGRKYLKPSRTCHHRSQCCDSCLKEYINHQYKQEASSIRCPSSSCNSHLDDVIIRQFLTMGQFNEYIARSNEANSLKTLMKTTKRCPNCKVRIEKSGGCDVMRCRCGHKFCWCCLVDFKLIDKEGNHKHLETCKHYFAYIW